MNSRLCRAPLATLAGTVLGGLATLDAAAAPSLEAEFQAEIRPLLENYCTACHGPEKQKGDLRLDELDPRITTLDHLERWVDVGDQLKTGEMPPAKAKARPTAEEYGTLIEWVSKNVKQSAGRLDPPERLQVRRLTREQYNASMQDLLGLPLNFAKELPAEALSEEGFSNDAELLNLSPSYIEFFLENAQRALEKVIVEGPSPAEGYQFVLRFDQLEEAIRHEKLNHFWPIYPDGVVRLGKKPKGETWPPIAAQYMNFPWKQHPKAKKPQKLIAFEDGMLVAPRAKLHYGQLKSTWGRLSLPGEKFRNRFPTEGWLRVRVRAGSQTPKGAAPPRLQVMLNYDVLHGKTLNDLGTREITAPKEKPAVYDFVVRLENLNLPSQDNEKGPPYFEIWNPRWESTVGANGKGTVSDTSPQATAFIKSVEVAWPLIETWPPASHTAILFDGDRSDERAYAREALERFVPRAFRRPVDDAELAPVVALYESERRGGRSLEAAMRTALGTVLCSPGFLYMDQSAKDGTLGQFPMASRLSYFLWNSMPDDELIQLAKDGKLHDSKILAEQANRMLRDPKSRRFVDRFASEWLDMPGLQNVAVNQEIFRGFSFATKDLLREETISFVAEILDHDLSVLEFIDSDFVMLNNRLASHYGVGGVFENVFHRVPAGEHRGGVLTQGSVLIATGTGEQSHPFRRGTYILERILGTPPPPPPATAPQLDKSDPDFEQKPLSEQLAVHREQASCASCHAKLDPWGLALENFNAIGQWRTSYKYGNKASVEATGTLPDGTRIDGVEGLKRVLREEKSDLFVRNFARKMLGYALARSLDATDAAAVDELAVGLAENDHRMRTFVVNLVKHPAFLKP